MLTVFFAKWYLFRCYYRVFGSYTIYMSNAEWIGRVIDGMGRALDNKGILPQGSKKQFLHNTAPSSHLRQPIEQQFNIGLHALNTFIPCCINQRLGIFAGSGVGKSVLMSTITKNAKADIVIIGLIGERHGEKLKSF